MKRTFLAALLGGMLLSPAANEVRAQWATNYDNAGREPQDPSLWRRTAADGRRALSEKEFDRAIDSLTRALRMSSTPESAAASLYGLRARAYAGKGEEAKARADYERARGVVPELAGEYADLARLHRAMGNYRGAGAAFRKATEIAPKDPDTWNDLAWFLATAPNKEARNGREAVEAAKRACEMTNWKKYEVIDTLAAAQAEAGNFEQAAQHQAQVLRKRFLSREERKDFEGRLAQYRQGQPYRDVEAE